MNTQQFEIAEHDRVRLRGVVATIDRELSRLALEAPPRDHREAERGLMASWAQLVELLALGIAPDVRECPVCKHVHACGHPLRTLLDQADCAGGRQPGKYLG